MLLPRLLCGVIGLTALLAVTAVCQDSVPGKSDPSPSDLRPEDPGSRGPLPGPLTPSVPQPPQLAVPATPLGSSAKPAGVDDLLDKLEGLKAKREAIEREEKATHALLKERLKAQQERIGKLGLVVPPLCEKQAAPEPDVKTALPPDRDKPSLGTERLPKAGSPPGGG
jgi:hypothetical protein